MLRYFSFQSSRTTLTRELSLALFFPTLSREFVKKKTFARGTRTFFRDRSRPRTITHSRARTVTHTQREIRTRRPNRTVSHADKNRSRPVKFNVVVWGFHRRWGGLGGVVAYCDPAQSSCLFFFLLFWFGWWLSSWLAVFWGRNNWHFLRTHRAHECLFSFSVGRRVWVCLYGVFFVCYCWFCLVFWFVHS